MSSSISSLRKLKSAQAIAQLNIMNEPDYDLNEQAALLKKMHLKLIRPYELRRKSAVVLGSISLATVIILFVCRIFDLYPSFIVDTAQLVVDVP